MGGDIEVESQEGKGSKFIIKLPLKASEGEVEEENSEVD